MSLTIEFSPQEEASLALAAQREGTDEATLLKRLVRDHLPQQPDQPVSNAPNAKAQAMLDLLRKWREEDATDDIEEIRRRDAEAKAFLTRLEENRFQIRREDEN